MATNSLSRRDFNVLEKIKDPESNPLAAVMVDPALPKDPNVTDATVYESIAQEEREIILRIQHSEMQLAGLGSAATSEPTEEYRRCIEKFGELISRHPKYASARNNRAQALRRLYGDTMLLEKKEPGALIQDANSAQRLEAALTALSDLDEAVKLLTPSSLFAPVSPQAGKTLALAHTQRAAIYHMTARLFQSNSILPGTRRKEVGWTQLDFEGAASGDFALGGRYGNEIAKGLAVSTNPTAKLCGQMVREAMKKEYGPAYAT
ncbi:hypothetical protein GGR56DRAFT_361856 [Xylariaceae sp. FL0804]|nr:hypothetical protein GGR56DRAFT_361856 [Xylariaceae sp. FL0804]